MKKQIVYNVNSDLIDNNRRKQALASLHQALLDAAEAVDGDLDLVTFEIVMMVGFMMNATAADPYKMGAYLIAEGLGLQQPDAAGDETRFSEIAQLAKLKGLIPELDRMRDRAKRQQQKTLRRKGQVRH